MTTLMYKAKVEREKIDCIVWDTRREDSGLFTNVVHSNSIPLYSTLIFNKKNRKIDNQINIWPWFIKSRLNYKIDCKVWNRYETL